mgnify:CR=1 FL=1
MMRLLAYGFAVASSALWTFMFLKMLMGEKILVYEPIMPVAAIELLLAFSSGVWFLANFMEQGRDPK